jgi:hypothetical protein
VTPAQAFAIIQRDAAGLRLPVFGVEDVQRVEVFDGRAGPLYAEVWVVAARTGLLLQLRREGEQWRLSGSVELPRDLSVDAVVLSFLEHMRPKPVPAKKTRLRRAGTPVDETSGLGTMARVVVAPGVPRAEGGEVDRAERSLGTRLPAGYRTFVTEKGLGILQGLVRVYPPDRIAGELDAWRQRIEQFWFWGDTPLDQATALECIVVADTLDGDELVFHPSDPDALYLLPRHRKTARRLGRGLGVAIGELIEGEAPVLEP